MGSFALLGALALGCGRAEKEPRLEPATPGSGGHGSEGVVAGAGGQSGEVVEPLDCTMPTPGESPLLRLNRVELENTLKVLFEDVPSVFTAVGPLVFQLPPEPAQRASYLPNALLVERYYLLARKAAAAATGDHATLVAFCGCDPEKEGVDACRDQMIERFATRAYRRPITDEDRSELREVFRAGQLGGDFASGVQAVVEVVLQSPDFLYLLELGTEEVRGAAVALSPYETATRVSYFLTAHPPDEDLRLAAASGPLTPAVIEEHARRLIGGAENRVVTRRFMEDLLGLQETLNVDRAAHPTFTPEIAAQVMEESARFIDDVTFEGAGTFQALFSQPTTWLNGPLAQFYGVAGINGDAFQRVQLDPDQRAGILTQAAFLSATSPGSRTSPVRRAMTVLRRVLCFTPDPPPASVAPILPPDSPPGATMRERLLADTAPASCQECHRHINPVGLAFENYDAVGLWRSQENGSPIDASGNLMLTDAGGSFSNAVELIQHIAASRDARSCFAGNWLSYAYGRSELPADACARQELETTLEESGGNVVELMVAIAKTDNLRYRLQSEIAP